MKQATHRILFVEAKISVPYYFSKQTLCSCIEDACSKKVYNILNPGIDKDVKPKYSYKIQFEDGEIVHIVLEHINYMKKFTALLTTFENKLVESLIKKI